MVDKSNIITQIIVYSIVQVFLLETNYWSDTMTHAIAEVDIIITLFSDWK